MGLNEWLFQRGQDGNSEYRTSDMSELINNDQQFLSVKLYYSFGIS